MKRWNLAVIALALITLMSGIAYAQEDGYYLSDTGSGDDGHRFALGIGFGFVELGDNVIEGGIIVNDDDVEPYYSLSLRIRIGDEGAHGGRGFVGYLEPELSYLSSDSAAGALQQVDSTDTYFGVNVIGSMPLGAVDFFVGGGLGIHFLDTDVRTASLSRSDSNDALGANAQFGVDVHLSEQVSIFALGRFDIVDDDRDELEGKAQVGLRFSF